MHMWADSFMASGMRHILSDLFSGGLCGLLAAKEASSLRHSLGNLPHLDVA